MVVRGQGWGRAGTPVLSCLLLESRQCVPASRLTAVAVLASAWAAEVEEWAVVLVDIQWDLGAMAATLATTTTADLAPMVSDPMVQA